MIFLFTIITATTVNAQTAVCRINNQPLKDSEWLGQARCLLRPVRMNRNLGPAPATLPEPLDQLVGKTTVVERALLKQYLQRRVIEESRLGGSVDRPLSVATYFIIHDTSTPHLVREQFPSNDVINGPEWNRGRINRLLSGQQTHVWIDRVGESATSRDYSLPTVKTGVKVEKRYRNLRGRLLHNELIQPRRCNPAVRVCCRVVGRETVCNDAIAPEPGFSEAQLDRLALLYVAASTRRGKWLIPAFHGVVDDEFGSAAHDDPQNFDLNLWANRLQLLLDDLGFRIPQ
jgi:hypothetical protein